MARMHSRKKGKAGSKRPIKKTVPIWLSYKPKEIELLITKLAKDGKSASEIGLTLRDNYGIPSVKVVCKKTVTEIIKENRLASKIKITRCCEKCGSNNNLERHHKDYSKPLEVQVLCKNCHTQTHIIEKEVILNVK